MKLDYQYNDGGRSAAFDTPGKNDCVTRAIAIITGMPYAEVWAGVHATGTVTRSGMVNTNDPRFRKYMDSLGLVYVVTLWDHIKNIDFPAKAIANVNGHYFAIVGNVMHDTQNPSPAGLKKCLGYWTPKPTPAELFNVVSAVTGAALNRAPLNHAQATTMAQLLKLNYKKESYIKPL